MFSLARILRSNAVTCRRTALACALSASLSATTALAQSPTPDTTDQSQSFTTTQAEFLTVNGVRHQVTDSPDTASLFTGLQHL
ncbi:hypothetical protein WH240_15475 [Gluconobacter wancherniae]|uniref:hypothetical protein n=1 Tax=Gluconobacter wancherniae TaxID=1307955 RepID=UPI0030A3A2EE